MSQPPDANLYATAAQVIPILFTVLVVDLGLFTSRQNESDHRTRYLTLTRLLVVALLVLGEVAALSGLTSSQDHGERTAVLTALFGGGLTLVLNVIGAPLQTFMPAWITEAVRNTALVVAVALWLLCFP